MIKAITAAGAVAVAFPLLIILVVIAGPAPTAAKAATPAGLAGAPTALAKADIPADYLVWYMDAAQTCPGLPWSVLAGIGTVESSNGQSNAPGVHSGHNFAGAEGPMQFLPATFEAYATGPDRPLSPYDPADAIYTAAAVLCASGARGGSAAGIEQAVFAYNHADWYVSEVMSWAAKYAVQGGSTAVATAIAFAMAQLGKPYQWGAAGPDAYDCSGLLYAAYAAAGIHIARTTYQWQQDGPVIPLSQIQPGDLLFSAGSDGTPSDPGHVVMYLGGGQVIQAPQPGEDVQIDPVDLASVVVATRPAASPASRDPDHPARTSVRRDPHDYQEPSATAAEPPAPCRRRARAPRRRTGCRLRVGAAQGAGRACTCCQPDVLRPSRSRHRRPGTRALPDGRHPARTRIPPVRAAPDRERPVAAGCMAAS